MGTANPNFPADLDIRPLTHASASNSDRKFDASAQEEAIREYGIAGRVWEAAYAMKTYLNPSAEFTFDPPFLSYTGPLRILELGSGIGIVAAQLAEQLTGEDDLMIVTDLPEVCPLLERNLQTHGVAHRAGPLPNILVRPLSWGNLKHALSIHTELSDMSPSHCPLTHIICSDLVSGFCDLHVHYTAAQLDGRCDFHVFRLVTQACLHPLSYFLC